jgi:hypothetical protein
MNLKWGRLATAVALSLSVFLLTHFIANQFRPQNTTMSEQKVIAYVQQISEEVERRPVTSLVWRQLSQGEPLHPGEAVKTSDKGEIRIQFADSTHYLDVDPESLIVLNQTKENEIALELTSGSLLVGQNEGKSQPTERTLTLNTPQGNIDLSKATAQISRAAGANVDVQVLKGTVNSGKNTPSSQIEILAPNLGEPVYLAEQKTILFRWKGFSEKAKVSFWVGKSRSQLKEMSSVTAPNPASFRVPLKPGSYYWKLVGTATESQGTEPVAQESAVYRLKVLRQEAPVAVAPLAGSLQPIEQPVEFKWLRPDIAKTLWIEIATDEQMSQKVFSQTFEKEDLFHKTLSPGKYFWRVQSSYLVGEPSLSSNIIPFTVGTVQLAVKPKVPVQIAWLDSVTKSPQFFTKEPQANWAWTTEQKDQVHFWRLKIAEDEKALTGDDKALRIEKELQALEIQTALKKPGRYIAMVEALDENKNILAQSQMKTIEIQALPILPAPKFVSDSEVFSADNEGRLNLKWTAVPGAQQYWLKLTNPEGKEIRRAPFKGQATALVNLLPGEYLISIWALDSSGRDSEIEAPRKVLVPDSSALEAPKVRKLQVK